MNESKSGAACSDGTSGGMGAALTPGLSDAEFVAQWRDDFPEPPADILERLKEYDGIGGDDKARDLCLGAIRRIVRDFRALSNTQSERDKLQARIDRYYKHVDANGCVCTFGDDGATLIGGLCNAHQQIVADAVAARDAYAERLRAALEWLIGEAKIVGYPLMAERAWQMAEPHQMSVKPRCPTCNDTGWITTSYPNGPEFECSCPEGCKPLPACKAVPIEPTVAMLDAGREAMFTDLSRKYGMKIARAGWKAMIHAATAELPAVSAAPFVKVCPDCRGAYEVGKHTCPVTCKEDGA